MEKTEMPANNKKNGKTYKRYLLLPFILLLCFSCSTKKAEVKKTPLFEAGAVFKEADDRIKNKLYEEARETLETIRSQDTTGKYAPLAQVRIGDTYFEEGLYEESAVEYRRFLENHPLHKHAYYAQYQIAMSYFNRIGSVDISYSPARNALREFEKLLRTYPRNPYISIVERRIQTCTNLLAEYEFYVGQFYFKKGSYSSAAARFDYLLQNYPDSRKEPDALYHLGLSYNNLGEYGEARSALTTLIEKYPDIILSRKAREIIASRNKEEK